MDRTSAPASTGSHSEQPMSSPGSQSRAESFDRGRVRQPTVSQRLERSQPRRESNGPDVMHSRSGSQNRESSQSRGQVELAITTTRLEDYYSSGYEGGTEGEGSKPGHRSRKVVLRRRPTLELERIRRGVLLPKTRKTHLSI